ncbi:hypothetical protein DID88_001406 [Monilinia fructigena]|uniref:TLC domain-containing protein n=1 Tax=Monilinia fructigena TaxID=38457 RepID=A0A395J2C1_9HELO|nr:hypothetical protein DID88_001406 [Monilinia fructigena]
MVHKVLFWTGFGLAVRAWQLGLEMRPFFNRQSLWVYPVFGGVGAFIWLLVTGKKRARRKEREAAEES